MIFFFEMVAYGGEIFEKRLAVCDCVPKLWKGISWGDEKTMLLSSRVLTGAIELVNPAARS